MATKAQHLTAIRASHSSLTRMVNGVSLAMDASEYEATINEWATVNAATDVRNEIIANGGASADYASFRTCLLYTSPSPRDRQKSRMPSSA